MAFVRIEFRLPTDATIAYFEDAPRPGRSVRGLAGEHFVVSRVDPDGTGGYIATCVTREEYESGRPSSTGLLRELRERVNLGRWQNRTP
jgi:hypothetical protein